MNFNICAADYGQIYVVVLLFTHCLGGLGKSVYCIIILYSFLSAKIRIHMSIQIIYT